MSVFFNVLTQNILPIMIVASFGFILRRRFDLHLGTMTSVVFNVLSPCLVFSSLVTSRLPTGELVKLSGFTALSIVLMGGLAFGLARLLRLGRAETASVLIAAMFVNGGNYGMTLLQLRYGDDGLARGALYFTTSTLLFYTVGALIASMGQTTWRQSLRRMARLPAFYAAVLAVLVYGLHIPIPSPIMTGVTLAGRGAIPAMLLVLGMQIADLRRSEAARFVWPTITLRLLVGPLVGLAAATAVGLSGLDRNAMIIEASMPTAVFGVIMATEFGLPTSAVARIVAFATLISPLTLAATISLLGL